VSVEELNKRRQCLQDRIEDMESEIASLESDLEQTRDELDKLESERQLMNGIRELKVSCERCGTALEYRHYVEAADGLVCPECACLVPKHEFMEAVR
jgi:chromosome segregation ATPase